MAEVFLSRATSPEGLQRNLVIKRILPELCRDEEFVTTFLNEARLASCLKHPNIVQIFDLGCVQESYFLSMEYVRGYDLSTIIHGHSRARVSVPVAIALSIAIDLFIGLDFAHHATDSNGSWLGVVHRDVTPGNVLVSHDGEAKILDFGIAKATRRDDNRTKNGTLKGKMAYLAPEQVVGGVVDMRADIYAATLTIYELIANVNPNRGETPYETLSNASSRDVPDIRQYRPDLPDRIAQIMHKGLSRDLETRYQSCGEIAGDLRRAANELGLRISHNAVRGYIKEHNALFESSASGGGESTSKSDITGRTLYLSATKTGSIPHLLGKNPNNPSMRGATGSIALTGPEVSYALLSEPSGKPPRFPGEPELATAADIIPDKGQPWPWLVGGLTIGVIAIAATFSFTHGTDKVADARTAAESAGEVAVIAIATDPPGAQVLLSQPDTGGFVLLTGTTPMDSISITPEVSYDYKVTLNGYRSVRGTFHVNKEEHRKVRVELHRE